MSASWAQAITEIAVAAGGLGALTLKVGKWVGRLEEILRALDGRVRELEESRK